MSNYIDNFNHLLNYYYNSNYNEIKSKFGSMIQELKHDPKKSACILVTTPEWGSIKLTYKFWVEIPRGWNPSTGREIQYWNFGTAFGANKRSKKNKHLTDDELYEVRKMAHLYVEELFRHVRNELNN